jgi:lauroyl/myristoyl acyltransferase
MGMLRALRVGLWLIRHLPSFVLRPLPFLFGVGCYLCLGSRRRMIIANQRQVLGDTLPLRLHWHACQVMINLFHSYHLLTRLAILPEERIRALVELRGEEQLQAALARGKGVIIIGAHIGNYNALAPFTALYHAPAGAFVEPVEPPELFDFVSALRGRTGLELFLPNREGVLGAMRLLKRNGLLMMAGDRYLGANGTLVRFFGRPTYLSHGPIILSQRSGAALLPAALERLPGGRLRATLRPPLPLASTGQKRADLLANMRLLAGALEETIRPVPEEWVLVAPVWSTDPAGQDAMAAAVESAERPTGARRGLPWLFGVVALVLLWRPWRRVRARRDRLG